jgi:DNA modification methylase
MKGRLEEGIAAFPDEIPRRLIKLFTFVGETILDPFLGSGTTMKVAKELGRNCWGYEIDLELKSTILEKVSSVESTSRKGDSLPDVIVRSDAKRLRSSLQKRVQKQRSLRRKNKAGS